MEDQDWIGRATGNYPTSPTIYRWPVTWNLVEFGDGIARTESKLGTVHAFLHRPYRLFPSKMNPIQPTKPGSGSGAQLTDTGTACFLNLVITIYLLWDATELNCLVLSRNVAKYICCCMFVEARGVQAMC